MGLRRFKSDLLKKYRRQVLLGIAGAAILILVVMLQNCGQLLTRNGSAGPAEKFSLTPAEVVLPNEPTVGPSSHVTFHYLQYYRGDNVFPGPFYLVIMNPTQQRAHLTINFIDPDTGASLETRDMAYVPAVSQRSFRIGDPPEAVYYFGDPVTYTNTLKFNLDITTDQPIVAYLDFDSGQFPVYAIENLDAGAISLLSLGSNDCVASFAQSEVEIPESGGAIQIPVTTNSPTCAWSFLSMGCPAFGACPAPNSQSFAAANDWLSPSTISGVGSTTVTLSAGPNRSASDRRVFLTTGVGYNSSAVVRQGQEGGCKVVALSGGDPKVFSSPRAGSSTNYQVTTNPAGCVYTVNYTSNPGSFFSATRNGDGSLTIATTPNTSARRYGEFSLGSRRQGIVQEEGSTNLIKDLPYNHLGAFYVAKMVENDIWRLDSNGNYGIDRQVRRDEMAAIIVRAKFGAKFESPSDPFFEDVSSGTPYFSEIQKLMSCEIVSGNRYPTSALRGLYGPTDLLTRGQMAVFITRARFGTLSCTFNRALVPANAAPPANPNDIFPYENARAYFDDVPLNPRHLFFQHIQKLFASGTTGGCSVNPAKYCPNDPIFHWQMAVFIARSFLGAP